MGVLTMTSSAARAAASLSDRLDPRRGSHPLQFRPIAPRDGNPVPRPRETRRVPQTEPTRTADDCNAHVANCPPERARCHARILAPPGAVRLSRRIQGWLDARPSLPGWTSYHQRCQRAGDKQPIRHEVRSAAADRPPRPTASCSFREACRDKCTSALIRERKSRVGHHGLARTGLQIKRLPSRSS